MDLSTKRSLHDAKDSSLQLWTSVGSVAVDPLISKHNSYAKVPFWSQEYQATQNVALERYMYDKCGIEKAAFIYCDDFLSQVFHFPLWESWSAVLGEFLKPLGIDPTRVVRCFLQRIPCGKGIKIHHDNGEWIFTTHRIQIPIVTNDSVLMFMGADKYNMQRVPLVQGQALELNNAACMSICNQSKSGSPALQLIVDYLEHPTPMRPIVLTAGQKLWQSRRTIDVEGAKSSPPLPAFVILGAQKAGTTALYEYLLQHPLVIPAIRKECHFLDWRWNPRAVSEGPLAWPLQEDAKSSAAAAADTSADITALREQYWEYFYREQLAKRPSLITGEGTPSYLLGGELIARRLHALCPDTKLIVLLRDPASRAFSHYQMVIDRNGTEEQLKNRGDAHKYSFEELVDIDIESMAKFQVSGDGYSSDEAVPRNANFERYLNRKQQFDGAHSYVGRGLYAAQLAPWFRVFPPSQILILRFEHMKTPAGLQQLVTRTCKFLGLPPQPITPDQSKENRRNYAAMNPATRQRLNEFYRPHNVALHRLMGAVYGEDAAREWEPQACGWT